MAKKVTVTKTNDSFTNWAAQLGYGRANQLSASNYEFNYITRNRTLLEAAYRGSWIVGQAVDAPAEDMTRAGIEIQSTMSPDDIQKLQSAMMELNIWQALCDNGTWARLFGGSIAVMLIDGQDMSTPLNIESIAPNQFKGLLVLDRWLVDVSLSNLVKKLGPDLGMPKFYTVVDGPALKGQRIHYSRVLRMEGLKLSYYQKVAENGWGESVIERIYDRLVAFDSATMGAGQLVFKAHLRVVQIEGLRELIAAGGPSLAGLAQQINMIRQYQTNEGMTVLDATDKFDAHQYTFAGLADIILQFGQQLSGATQVPLVRLFGQSPAGLNSTGESDLRTYYDHINKTQEAQLRRPLTGLLQVLCRSVLGFAPPEDFNFKFNPLWQVPDKEKAEIGTATTASVKEAYDAGIVSRSVSLKELKQNSHISGLWSNITDEDIADAEDEPPLSEQVDDETKNEVEEADTVPEKPVGGDELRKKPEEGSTRDRKSRAKVQPKKSK